MKPLKRVFILAWLLLTLGIALKIFHAPGSGLTIVVSGVVFLLHSILHAIKAGQKNIPAILIQSTITSWAIYIIFRIQYWSGHQWIFYLAGLLSVSTILVMFNQRTQIRAHMLVACFVGLLGLTLHFVPSYDVYRVLNLNSLFNQDNPVEQYDRWDTYSWALYCNGKFEEALKANLKAKEGVVAAMQNPNDLYAKAYHETILRHNNAIMSGSWNQWP